MKNLILICNTIAAFYFCVCSAKGQTMLWSKKANPLGLSINSVAFNASGDRLISGTDCHPASIRMFKTDDGELTWDYEVGSDFMCIMGVTFSSNSKFISAIEEFGNVLLFDNSGAIPVIKDTLKTGTSYAFSTCISPDGKLVAVGCSNGKLKVFELESGKLKLDINAHPNWVTTVTFSKDGAYLISGGSDDRLKLWDMNGSLQKTIIGHSGDITQVKVSNDNSVLASSSLDGLIKVWKLSTGELISTLSGHSGGVKGIDFSPNGNMLVSVSLDSSVKLWQLNGAEVATFGKNGDAPIHAVAWSPIGNHIVTGNRNSDIVVWDVSQSIGLGKLLPAENLLFAVYPNPAHTYINLAVALPIQVHQITITNPVGQTLYTSANAQQAIPIHWLSPGRYFIQIETNQSQLKTSFIKN